MPYDNEKFTRTCGNNEEDGMLGVIQLASVAFLRPHLFSHSTRRAFASNTNVRVPGCVSLLHSRTLNFGMTYHIAV